ncbi:MAG: hypothetical protein CL885_00510 [Dehalococcoidia bacterium]|nr:hypothetical protein [Dehalococcoidia bacterium]
MGPGARASEASVTVKDLCRKYGMSDPSYYKWKAKYFSLEVNEVGRFCDLEEEKPGH